jgi:Bacterial PH domain
VGFLDGLLGNASEISASQVQTDLAQLLTPDERVDKAFQLIRDTFVFTNKRFIFINRQGLTGKKVEYKSIPYRSITRFSIETAGTFDLDAELKIWITGKETPLQFQFTKKLNIYTVQSVLAGHLMG